MHGLEAFRLQGAASPMNRGCRMHMLIGVRGGVGGGVVGAVEGRFFGFLYAVREPKRNCGVPGPRAPNH